MIQPGLDSFRSTGSSLGHAKILTFVGNPALWMDGKIPNVCFVNNRIRYLVEFRLIFGPSLRIRSCKIDNGSPVSINSNSSCIRVGSFVPLISNANKIGV
ncbi:hypothetical protein D3C87_1944700 [compost metagenome]